MLMEQEYTKKYYKIGEVAKMLSGSILTEAAINNAKELLEL